MSVFTACVLYAIIWWTALFLVLPFGADPAAEPDEHTGWRGAPRRPDLLRKAVATTILATAIWGGAMVVISHRDWLSFRTGWLAIPQD